MSILEIELKPSIQNRSLRVFLDLVILRMLSHRSMTGYEINTFFVEKYGIMIGPSTIYSKLTALEQNGWIQVIREKPGRIYSLTEQGQKMVNNIPKITKEIQVFIQILLGSR